MTLLLMVDMTEEKRQVIFIHKERSKSRYLVSEFGLKLSLYGSRASEVASLWRTFRCCCKPP